MSIKEMFDDAWERQRKRPYVQPEARRDLRAFNLLNKLVPGTMDIVSCAEHDQIWLEVSIDELSMTELTQDQVDELVECGVHIDESTDSLTMFV